MYVHEGMFTYIPICEPGVKVAIAVKENLIKCGQQRLDSGSDGQAVCVCFRETGLDFRLC